MHAELSFPAAAITTFLLALSRTLGVFLFIPFPGKESGPSMPRILLAFATAISVFPYWSWVSTSEPSIGTLILWLVSELALGLTIGLLVSFLAEGLTIGAHTLALQAGYAYASIVDPTTQADSDVMQVLAQLMGGLLFFSFQIDHLAVRTFIYSLRSFPPGQFAVSHGLLQGMIALSANAFDVALRLALPAVALLLTTEVALAVTGRLSSQLQLVSHATSVKMLITLVILATLIRVAPELYKISATHISEILRSSFWSEAASPK